AQRRGGRRIGARRPLHPGGEELRYQEPARDFRRSEGPRHPSPQQETGAARISGRLLLRLQSGHVRHQAFCRRHQPAARHDPGGGGRRGARLSRERADQDRPVHDRDPVLRPPFGGWRAGRRSAGCLQDADRKPGDDAGLGAGRMKTILAYGDSLTYGADPGGGARHAFEDRWPSALERRLDGKARVIAEGLGGRTTAYDDWTVGADRNGARILPTLLASHAPLDLVIIMLGTNDLKPFLGGSAAAAARGARRLVEL